MADKVNDISKLVAIAEQIKIMKTHAVKVGIPADVGIYPNGASILTVANVHEYGLGVPRRSFIRVPMDKETAKLQKALKDGYNSIVENGADTVQTLNKLGILAQNISKNSFKNQGYGEWKDISDATKKAKGSNKILFDTGRLVQSIKYWVVKD